MNKHSQQGAVLVVSLVLLLIITAIAVSTMTSGTFQTVISNNAQLREGTFHTAESAVEQALSQLGVSTSTITDQAKQAQKTNTVYTVTGLSASQQGVNTATTATVKYAGDMSSARLAIIPGVDPGSTSGGHYYTVNYEVSGRANSTDSRISSNVIAGIARIEFWTDVKN